MREAKSVGILQVHEVKSLMIWGGGGGNPHWRLQMLKEMVGQVNECNSRVRAPCISVQLSGHYRLLFR